MSGATPSLPLHAFVACAGAILLSRDGLRNGTLTFVSECLYLTLSDSRHLNFACRACCVVG